jgi:hypothetical protein
MAIGAADPREEATFTRAREAIVLAAIRLCKAFRSREITSKTMDRNNTGIRW